jgi:hypothetical protein
MAGLVPAIQGLWFDFQEGIEAAIMPDSFSWNIGEQNDRIPEVNRSC